MSKDEIILLLREQLSKSEVRAEKAEAELERIREAARNRQSRHRHVTVTSPVTPPQRDSHVASPPRTPVSSLSKETPIKGVKKGSLEPDHEFDSFRDVYPKTGRTGWPETRRLWDALHHEEHLAVLRGARNYAGSKDVADGFTKGAQVWLRGRFWESWQEPEAKPENGTGQHRYASLGGVVL